MKYKTFGDLKDGDLVYILRFPMTKQEEINQITSELELDITIEMIKKLVSEQSLVERTISHVSSSAEKLEITFSETRETVYFALELKNATVRPSYRREGENNNISILVYFSDKSAIKEYQVNIINRFMNKTSQDMSKLTENLDEAAKIFYELNNNNKHLNYD